MLKVDPYALIGGGCLFRLEMVFEVRTLARTVVPGPCLPCALLIVHSLRFSRRAFAVVCKPLQHISAEYRSILRLAGELRKALKRARNLHRCTGVGPDPVDAVPDIVPEAEVLWVTDLRQQYRIAYG